MIQYLHQYLLRYCIYTSIYYGTVFTPVSTTVLYLHQYLLRYCIYTSIYYDTVFTPVSTTVLYLNQYLLRYCIYTSIYYETVFTPVSTTILYLHQYLLQYCIYTSIYYGTVFTPVSTTVLYLHQYLLRYCIYTSIYYETVFTPVSTTVLLRYCIYYLEFVLHRTGTGFTREPSAIVCVSPDNLDADQPFMAEKPKVYIGINTRVDYPCSHHIFAQPATFLAGIVKGVPFFGHALFSHPCVTVRFVTVLPSVPCLLNEPFICAPFRTTQLVTTILVLLIRIYLPYSYFA